MGNFYDQDRPNEYVPKGGFSHEESSSLSDDEIEGMKSRLSERSTTGSPRRSRSEREKIRKQAKIRRKAFFGATCLALGIFVSNGIGYLQEKMEDRAYINENALEFQVEVISPNTHRTDDNKHHWYDYARIADGVLDPKDDFGNNVYYASVQLGGYIDNVMRYTEYGTLEGYAESLGFDSVKEWKKNQEEKIATEGRIEKKQEEIRSMQAEVDLSQNTNSSDSTYGGK